MAIKVRKAVTSQINPIVTTAGAAVVGSLFGASGAIVGAVVGIGAAIVSYVVHYNDNDLHGGGGVLSKKLSPTKGSKKTTNRNDLTNDRLISR